MEVLSQQGLKSQPVTTKALCIVTTKNVKTVLQHLPGSASGRKLLLDDPFFVPSLILPSFARKHMDKHNRPYICEERGCEKILGFTYSGGLLRHQREVHRQHGGPKASCMCPHSDCKRSTGTGFSRRENLIEHLRRVHRDVEDRSGDSPLPKGPEKKRRRAANDETKDENEHPPEDAKRRKTIVDDDVVEDRSGSKDLQAKVKQLELELQQKDERLRKLEETVERLAKGQ